MENTCIYSDPSAPTKCRGYRLSITYSTCCKFVSIYVIYLSHCHMFLRYFLVRICKYRYPGQLNINGDILRRSVALINLVKSRSSDAIDHSSASILNLRPLDNGIDYLSDESERLLPGVQAPQPRNRFKSLDSFPEDVFIAIDFITVKCSSSEQHWGGTPRHGTVNLISTDRSSNL